MNSYQNIDNWLAQLFQQSNKIEQNHISKTVNSVFNTKVKVIKLKKMKGQFYNTNGNKVLQLQTFLQKHQYFSKDCLPGIADALMMQIFDKQFPNKNRFPAIYYWYINLKQFSHHEINNWSIASDKDGYFFDILNKYLQHYSKNSQIDSTTRSNNHEQNDIEDQDRLDIQTYQMNLRLKPDKLKEMMRLKRQIQRKSQILKCDQIGNTIMNITIKCSCINIQLIKALIEKQTILVSYSIKKIRPSRILRAQTFNCN